PVRRDREYDGRLVALADVGEEGVVEKRQDFARRQRHVTLRLEADVRTDRGRDGLDLGGRELAAAGRVAVQRGRLRGGDEAHVGEPLDEADVVVKLFVRGPALLRRLRRRQLPLLPRRVGTAAEVDPVPEFLVDELARVVVDAHYAAALRQESA